jgi:4-amino-4-deoxy-L-arabinose transferase-like glycosyltransferase
VSELKAPAARERGLYALLAASLVLVWLATLASRPLFNPDEGRYAEIPREMLQGGDWLIPHINGLPYIEKPPLQYWATAFSFELFGENEFAARLYTALCALGCLALVFATGRRQGGEAQGWRAAAVLAGTLLFLLLGQLLTLDMSLTFYLTASLAAFLQAQRGARTGFADRRWMLIAWAATALGVLTKGIVAAAIPAAVLVIYSVASRDFAPWRRLYPTLGLPLFLIISVPWHWLAARRLDDFLQFYVVHEHFARYLTPVAQRVEPWWFFVAVFVAGSTPWIVSALRVVALGWRSRAPGAFNEALFLWIWVIFVCGFFSLSDSKLIPYILPAMPALALLIAALPAEILKKDLLRTALLTVIVGAAVGLVSFNWTAIVPKGTRGSYFLPLSASLATAAVLISLSGAYVLLQQAREPTRATLFLGLGWCLAWLVLMRGAAAVAPIYSGLALARAVPADAAAAPVYSVGTYDQTLPFYLGRTVKLVHFRGELDYGLKKNPAAEIEDLDEFLREWRAAPQAFALMESTMFDQLRQQGAPMRVIAQASHRVLAARQ